MNTDSRRARTTLGAILVTFVINLAAIVIPLGGKTTGEISDQFRVYLVPSGPTFAIWGVIYTLLLAFGIYQALPRARETALLRGLGWLPVVSCAFNSTWIVVWQYEAVSFVPSLVAILGLLVSLALVQRRTRAAASRTERWLVAMPFSFYFGWVTVATVLNVAVVLTTLGVAGIGGLDDRIVAAAVLLVATAIATTVVLRERDAGYGLAVVWALNGIYAKETATPYVAEVALLGVALVGLAAVAMMAARATGRLRVRTA
jgi:benzodiazapine receptor